MKLGVDFLKPIRYNNTCVDKRTMNLRWTQDNIRGKAGCGSAWLERLIWDQEVAGSNPVTPTDTFK